MTTALLSLKLVLGMNALPESRDPQIQIENLSDIHLFTNPFMKTSLLSYQLIQHANMAMVIQSQDTQQELRRILKPAGMPGGQRGYNKVFWDGTRADGIKVAPGRYQVTLYENNQVKYHSHAFRLGG